MKLNWHLSGRADWPWPWLWRFFYSVWGWIGVVFENNDIYILYYSLDNILGPVGVTKTNGIFLYYSLDHILSPVGVTKTNGIFLCYSLDHILSPVGVTQTNGIILYYNMDHNLFWAQWALLKLMVLFSITA